MILLLAALAVLDYCFIPALQNGAARPIALYLPVLYVAFRWPREKIAPAAMAVGLVRDLLSSGPLGVELTSLIFSGLLLDLAVQKMDRNSEPVKLAVTFLFVQTAFLIQWVLGGLLGFSQFMTWHALSVSFGSAVLTTVVAPLFYMAAGRLFRDDGSMLKQYELFG